MSKSSRKNRQKEKLPIRRSAKRETPEELPEAITWLRKVLATSYSMNEEGILRLKGQFDQIFDDHISEFNKKLRKANFENTEMIQECLAAKEILGHLLAVCKYLERILDAKKLSQQKPPRQRDSDALSRLLHRDLTQELRSFSRRLEYLQSVPIN
ncbi:MAG: hypothetical protein ACFFCF_08905 [Promethearchaeota archaeon]